MEINKFLLLNKVRSDYNKNFTNIFVDDSIQPERFSFLKKSTLENKLNLKFKFNFVNNFKKADIVLFLVNSSKNLINLEEKYNYLLEIDKPVILLERQDSAITWCREIENIKNLKAIFKNRIFRDKNLQNTDNLYCGKYNYFLTKELVENKEIVKTDIGNTFYSKDKLLPKIKDKFLDKIKCVLWDFQSSPLHKKENSNIKMNIYRSLELNETESFNKEYDIFCINQLKNNPCVDVLKIRAKNFINTLSNKYKVITNSDNFIEPQKYTNFLLKSKICVACWGFGEWVHMDAYAMYSGSILIKPYCDHVLMFPDIYKANITYIPCKPDYSDLVEILETTLTNYNKYIPMLKSNRDLLCSLDEKKAANLFWQEVLNLSDS